MRSFKFAQRLLRLLAFSLAASALPSPAAAQVWQGSKTPPPAKPQTQPSTPRPRARTTPARRAPARPPKPLLSFQYRVLKVEPNGTQLEVNPITVFNAGDRFRFSVKASEEGFLYIIQQRDLNEAGRILFPDSRVNGGQNFVRRNQEFTVPSGCVPGTTSWDCAFSVDDSTGQDYYTIIFSRDATPNLPPDAAEPNGDIRANALRRHWAASRQKLTSQQRGDTIFSLRLTNLNTRADQEIIVRYLLNKKGQATTNR